MGKGFKKAIKGVGRVVGKGLKLAAPAAMFIPGIGPVAAGGMAAASKLLGRALTGQNTFGGGGLEEGLMAGATAGGGKALLGLKSIGGVKMPGGGSFGRSIGEALKRTYTTPEGNLDLGRVAGTGLGAAQFLGARSQRRSAERYNNALTSQRNALMTRVMQQPQYDFSPTEDRIGGQ